MRQLYQEKWKLFQQKVTEELDGLVRPMAESASMHLVMEGDFDDVAMSQWH